MRTEVLVQSEMIGDVEIKKELSKVFVIRQSDRILKIEKDWEFQAEGTADNWFEYVIREIKQHANTVTTHIPAVIKNYTSLEAERTMNSLLARI